MGVPSICLWYGQGNVVCRAHEPLGCGITSIKRPREGKANNQLEAVLSLKDSTPELCRNQKDEGRATQRNRNDKQRRPTMERTKGHDKLCYHMRAKYDSQLCFSYHQPKEASRCLLLHSRSRCVRSTTGFSCFLWRWIKEVQRPATL